MAGERRAWSFSFFAAGFALFLQWALFSYYGLIELPWPQFWQLAFITIDAFVSARLGSLLAYKHGTIDHGFWAGTLTWWIFSTLLSIYFFVAWKFPGPVDWSWQEISSFIVRTLGFVVSVFYFSSFIAAPASLLGSGIFLLLVMGIKRAKSLRTDTVVG